MNVVSDKIILFDGMCNLCSESVQFVLKRDPKLKFRYASLQSNFGQEIARKYQLPAKDFDSFLLLEGDKLYMRSTAALRVLKRLNGLWPLLYGLIIIPPFIRNVIYDWIAANRYKWFGKKNECWLPKAEWKDLFLE